MRPIGNALAAEGRRGGERTVLVVPQTYMNRSGEALRKVLHGPADESVIAVYDDVDLPRACSACAAMEELEGTEAFSR